MQVIAGERSVTIRVSYDDADGLATMLRHTVTSQELQGMIVRAVEKGRAKGFPLPPRPKNEVAHNSIVSIVGEE